MSCTVGISHTHLENDHSRQANQYMGYIGTTLRSDGTDSSVSGAMTVWVLSFVGYDCHDEI